VNQPIQAAAAAAGMIHMPIAKSTTKQFKEESQVPAR
jgi:hypothetical protein